jgi:hypothetical protein
VTAAPQYSYRNRNGRKKSQRDYVWLGWWWILMRP